MNSRLIKSFETYQRYIKEYQAKGYKTYQIDIESYGELYKGIRTGELTGKATKQNIARSVARNYGLITSTNEARQLHNQILEDYGNEIDPDEIFSIEDIKGLSGREKWDYLVGLGYDERQAGYIYDGGTVVKGLKDMSGETINALRRKK